MNLFRPIDNILWDMFRKGDNEALTVIYSENVKKLYLYGLKLTSNRSIIEDSIHDLFSDLTRNKKNLGDTDNIHYYLIKSFKRNSYDNSKRKNVTI
jgi:RNA polymerase sigma-70 factor (ECF subfamily)